MSTPPAAPSAAPSRRNHWMDLTPLRSSPAFARLWAGNAIAGMGAQVTLVAVGLHIYELTSSTFAVGLVGVIALVPMIVAGLYGGMLADAFDRRQLLIWSAVVAWFSTAGLAGIAWLGVEELWPYYLLTTINSVAATVMTTVRFAVIPRLLPISLLASASALSGASIGLMLTVGPALAGVLVATVGYAWTYTVDVVLFCFGFLGIVTLPAILPDEGAQRPGFRSLREGLGFLRRARNIRMSFLVDLVAMTFGQPRSLLPAAAALVLGGGAITVGALISAMALGTLISSLFSGQARNVRRHGIAIGRSIAVYGACVLAFGVLLLVLSLVEGGRAPDGPVLWAIVAACLFMAGMGASDNISSVFRTTMMQTATPDRMLGRLQGVFIVVVNGGPRVGDLYVGILGGLLAVWAPPLFGGLIIIVLIATMVRLQPTFRHYDALDPVP